MPYEKYTPLNRFGSHASFPALGAPPGVSMQPQMAELLREVVAQLGLQEAGIVTPWAGRISDFEWQEIKDPDTNVAMANITDARVRDATSALFGQPLPFLTVLTEDLQTNSELLDILNGSAYELFQTQAVYRQDDSKDVPQVWFLHWLRVLDEADIPRQTKSLDEAAAAMHGRLMFSQQVPVESSTVRSVPSVSFETALNTQEPPALLLPPMPIPPGITPVPGVDHPIQESPPPFQTVPEPPLPAPQKRGILGPVLLGLGVAAATVAIAKAVRK